MCGGRFATPTGGIPIPEWIHEQFPQEVKDAWQKFHDWWQEQDRPVSRKSMPADVVKAYQTIKSAPIPEHQGFTGKDSCYILGVEGQLVD